ncbi:MAG TPA: hypothetical protein VMT24_10095, partial [Aggregatilineaceae bacterium]|nr:hypothetical protein [Aggregatilineaceae bacterium]
GGNCISLMLNQGYGWAADVNLKFIFERIFSVESGIGYPPHRRESQQQSRQTLCTVSQATHRPFAEIIACLPQAIVRPVLEFPGVKELLDVDTIEDEALMAALSAHMK